MGEKLPIYQCPKCGRRVELPEGTYYCKICGPEYILVPVEPEEEESIEELEKEILHQAIYRLDKEMIKKHLPAVKEIARTIEEELRAAKHVRLFSPESLEEIETKLEMLKKAIREAEK